MFSSCSKTLAYAYHLFCVGISHTIFSSPVATHGQFSYVANIERHIDTPQIILA
jgi:hypothetical protein